MQAMILNRRGAPLELGEVPERQAGARQLEIAILACAVCRTDLHVVDGDLPPGPLPIIPGHEIVGRVRRCGSEATGFSEGDLVGVPWLGGTCGTCGFCRAGRENLCEHAKFTGYTLDGGFAESAVAGADFCIRLPENRDPVEMAPWLCAGLIGYRSYRFAGEARTLGFYGFGAAAHLLQPIAQHQGREVFAFTRPGDERGQRFARSRGAAWAGDSDQDPPRPLDAAIIFAPVGDLVPRALRSVRKGGTVVCAGIHMSEIPAFPYELLWGERVVRSVANLTRRDGEEFFRVVADVPLHTEVHTYPLERANEALDDLRHGRFDGAAVLVNGG